ncbi:hypothetical protein [Burkholderia paludis]|uniref:hypothetical protein n=1 Tax=Burkholderia paludis TaxID=1506587 RepID=UPI001376AC69|nr:hypothetical protein [Burkholderia paludis]
MNPHTRGSFTTRLVATPCAPGLPSTASRYQMKAAKPVAKIATIAVVAALSACMTPTDSPLQTIAPLPIAGDGPCCGPVTAQGQQLLRALDRLDVEHHWPANREVRWDTGEPVGDPSSPVLGPDTHCSLFTAAVGNAVGIYLPRPPRDSQNFLSHTQLDFFESRAGREAGWFRVDTPAQAQALANRGYLVIFGYFRPKSAAGHAEGHVAVVRPSATRTAAQIREGGVLETHAGIHNHASAVARRGFPASEFPNLRYFAHAIDVDRSDPPAPSPQLGAR